MKEELDMNEYNCSPNWWTDRGDARASEWRFPFGLKSENVHSIKL